MALTPTWASCQWQRKLWHSMTVREVLVVTSAWPVLHIPLNTGASNSVTIFSATIFSEVLISKGCTSQPNVFGLRWLSVESVKVHPSSDSEPRRMTSSRGFSGRHAWFLSFCSPASRWQQPSARNPDGIRPMSPQRSDHFPLPASVGRVSSILAYSTHSILSIHWTPKRSWMTTY